MKHLSRCSRYVVEKKRKKGTTTNDSLQSTNARICGNRGESRRSWTFPHRYFVAVLVLLRSLHKTVFAGAASSALPAGTLLLKENPFAFATHLRLSHCILKNAHQQSPPSTCSNGVGRCHHCLVEAGRTRIIPSSSSPEVRWVLSDDKWWGNLKL